MATQAYEAPYEADSHAVPAGIVPVTVRRTSWGAIFAGVAIALVVQILLTLVGFAIGLDAVDPARGQDWLASLGTAAVTWWAASGVVSLFIGGWVAGRLAGFPRSLVGTLHGLVVWSAVTLLSVILATSAVGSALGARAGALSAGASALDLAAGAGASGLDSGDQDAVVSILVERAEMSRQDAERAVDGWMRQQRLAARPSAGAGIDSAGNGAEQAAGPGDGQASEALAAGSLWAVIAMLLGAAAAAVGGMLGAPSRSGPTVA